MNTKTNLWCFTTVKLQAVQLCLIAALIALIGFGITGCTVDKYGNPSVETIPDSPDGPGGQPQNPPAGTTAVPVPDGRPEEPPSPPAVTTPTTHDINNNIATLGITGTSVRSSNDKIATAVVNSEKIVVTSVGIGTVTITVEGPADKSDAEIEIRVAEDGLITQGRIVKGGEDVIIISGTFGGVTVAGVSRPVLLRVKFDWDEIAVNLEPGFQNWSVKHIPFDEDTPLWFETVIPTDGTFEYPEDSNISYQYAISKTINNSSTTGISIPAVTIPNLITINGTASASLKGTWDRTKKYVRVEAVNDSITTETWTNTFEEGWTRSETYVVNGQWSLKIPSSSISTDISFGVYLNSFQASDEWNYLGYWEMGKKNKLNPTIVSNQNKSNINLGTIPFVMVSGNTPVTVNGTRPFAYRIEFGYYWDEDPTVEINGWSGSTMEFFEANRTGSKWTIPMPADTKLEASIIYYEKSKIQLRKGSDGVVIFNTGTEPSTLNLSSISSISK